jgi:hypothetical protein
VQAGSTAFLELVNGNSYRYDIQSNSADNSLRFVDQSAGSERARIDSSGNLLVGPTSNLYSNRAYFAGGPVGNQTRFTMSSSTQVTIASCQCAMILIRDINTGTAAMVFYFNAGTPVIVSQSSSVFTTSSPGAGQIQVLNKSGNEGVNVLAGSSYNGVQINVGVFMCN